MAEVRAQVEVHLCDACKDSVLGLLLGLCPSTAQMLLGERAGSEEQSCEGARRSLGRRGFFNPISPRGNFVQPRDRDAPFITLEPTVALPVLSVSPDFAVLLPGHFRLVAYPSLLNSQVLFTI